MYSCVQKDLHVQNVKKKKKNLYKYLAYSNANTIRAYVENAEGKTRILEAIVI